jgi:hypothetical protein
LLGNARGTIVLAISSRKMMNDSDARQFFLFLNFVSSFSPLKYELWGWGRSMFCHVEKVVSYPIY